MPESLWQRPRGVGISYNREIEAAAALAQVLRSEIEGRGILAWVADQDDGPANRARAAESDLMICLGGDGSVLTCAHMVLGLETLILGVNLGRLGFLTELQSHEISERLDEVLAGHGRVEERSMIQAVVPRQGEAFHVLNDFVIGRAKFGRAIQLAVDIDSIRIADYRCDAVIVATATGSTAYGLSVGGPILNPESPDLVMVPVAPHLAASNAVVFPASETLRITLEARQQGALTGDGQTDVELGAGDSVVISSSPHKTRFLRLYNRTDFYVRMAARLGWHRPAGNAAPLPEAGAPIVVAGGST
jgi:NAD+ kinase